MAVFALAEEVKVTSYVQCWENSVEITKHTSALSLKPTSARWTISIAESC